MAISEKEWAALPEEEKEKCRKEFKSALREVLKGYDRETIRVALQSTLNKIKKERR